MSAHAELHNTEARGIALHVTPSDLRLQSRIDRVTRFVRAQGYFENVEVAGMGGRDLPNIEIQDDGRVYRRFRVRNRLREASRLTRALDFLIWYMRVAAFYRPRRVACVNAHTLSVLPLCWLLSMLKRCKLVYEPHELETETLTVRGPMKPLLKFAERLFIGAADAVIVVNGAIGEWYRNAYGLARVHVVRNLPGEARGEELMPSYYADRFGFPAGHMVFLYQGLIGRGRGIALLLAAAEHIPEDRHIVFLGFGPEVEAVQRAAQRRKNVHYHPAVPSDVLMRYTRAASVSLMMIEDVSLSYRYCYPNKYCESLTAGVPVICSDFLWLRAEVEQYRSGWACACDAQALAGLITKIDHTSVAEKKAGAARWARENSWAHEECVLKEIYAAVVR